MEEAAVADVSATPLLIDVSFPLAPYADEYLPVAPLKGGRGPYAAYVRALCDEAEVAAPDFGDYRVEAVQISGGDPGMMSGNQIRSITRVLHRSFAVPHHTELTVELTPGRISVDFLSSVDSVFRLRPSVRLVSAVPEELIALGARFKLGTVQDLMELFGCRNINDFSFEVSYGLFRQTERSLRYTLEQAVRLGAGHISLAAFQVRAGSESAHLIESGALTLPSAEQAAQMLEAGEEFLSSHGFENYASGQYALPGHRSACYEARASGCPCLGVGLNARSRFEDMEVVNTGDFAVYVAHPKDPAYTCASSRIVK